MHRHVVLMTWQPKLAIYESVQAMGDARLAGQALLVCAAHHNVARHPSKALLFSTEDRVVFRRCFRCCCCVLACRRLYG